MLLSALLLALQEPCLPLADVETLGAGTRGVAGAPELVVLGLPALGQPGAGLRLRHGAPRAPAQLVLSLASAPTPLPAYGATLWPAAPQTRWATVLDAEGDSPALLSGPAALPSSFCGVEVVVQGLVLDAAAQGGAAFTAARRLSFGAGVTAAGLFALPRSYPVPDQLYPFYGELVTGDLDGNGRQDVVMRLAGGEGVRVLRQLADGTLAPVQSFPPALGPLGLDLADVDGDGPLDVVATTSSAIAVLPGLGNGAFGPAWLTPAPSLNLGSLVAGDVTGDGRVDVVVASWLPDTLALLAGVPGGFAPAQTVAVPDLAYASHVRLADVDGDGWLDVLLTTKTDLVVVPSLGPAGLAAPQHHAIDGEATGAFDVGDIDGDGAPDVVLSAFSPALGVAVMVLLDDGTLAATPFPFPIEDLRFGDLDGNGSDEVLIADGYQVWSAAHAGGGLLADQAVLLAESARRLVPRDMDGDGKLDLAVGTVEGFVSFASWRAGAGDGSLVQPPSLADFPATMSRAVDLDGDGDLDLVGRLAGGALGVVLREAHGFGPVQPVDAGGEVRRLEVGDVDLDGKADVTVTHLGSSWPGVALLRGRGDGGFAAPAVATASSTHTPRLADLDGDGRLELIVSQTGSTQALSVYAVLSDGSLGPPAVTSGGSGRHFAVGDVDGDGWVDAVSQGSEQLFVFHGTGGLHFAPPVSLPDPWLDGGYDDLAIELGDLDGDGDLDLVHQDAFDQTRLKLNDGAGHLAPAALAWGYAGEEITLVDVNADGAPDIVGSGVWLGFGDGTFTAFQPGAVGGAAGDLDGDGDVDFFREGTLFLNALE